MSITAQLRSSVAAAAELNVDLDDRECIDAIAELERLKAAASAAQIRLTEAFYRSQLTANGTSDSEQAEARRSIKAQVALARADAPKKGDRHVGLAAALVREMPGVLAALSRGDTSEWRATLVAQETVYLSPEQRAAVDARIAPHLAGWGDLRTKMETRRIVIQLDPQAAVQRASKAASDRRVTIRPAADAMSYVTALLPVADGVACYAALHHHAATAATDPDDHRTRGQVMADTFTARLLGSSNSREEGGARKPITAQVHLVMTDRTLLEGDDEPAELLGYGPIPAPVARDLVIADPRTVTWVRRLFTDTVTGQLAGSDSRRRRFPRVAKEFLLARDRYCRTPYCGAPIDHADHAVAFSRGGTTVTTNGAGRCATCNYVKDTPGWITDVDPDGAITTTTPTGRRLTSRPPDPPGQQRQARQPSPGRRRDPGSPRLDIRWLLAGLPIEVDLDAA